MTRKYKWYTKILYWKSPHKYTYSRAWVDISVKQLMQRKLRQRTEMFPKNGRNKKMIYTKTDPDSKKQIMTQKSKPKNDIYLRNFSNNLAIASWAAFFRFLALGSTPISNSLNNIMTWNTGKNTYKTHLRLRFFTFFFPFFCFFRAGSFTSCSSSFLNA